MPDIFSQSVTDSTPFHEEQRFRQPWLWALLGTAAALTVGVMSFRMKRQLIDHQPWGSNPLSDGALAIVGTLMILISVGVLILVAKSRLITEVRGDGVYIRFIPFHRRFHWFQFRDILSAEEVTYRPRRDYGGWGIRYGRTGMAYTVCGHRGLLLTFGNGSTLLIGSQRADELAELVRKNSDDRVSHV